MSAMVISSIKRFIEMSPKLEELGLSNIHFYNSETIEDIDTPMIALVPFIDCVILGKEAKLSGQLTQVIDEAFARRIPF